MLRWQLDDEARRNPVSPAILEFIAARCGELQGEVVVLTGAGERAFCSGFDLARIGDVEEDSLPDAPLFEATGAMRNADATLVAAIGGVTIGAGVELACACDLRVAVDTATFTIPAARLGVVYHAVGLANVRTTFGPALTARMLLAGETVTAAEALTAGALAHAVPRHAFAKTVDDLVGALRSGAPLSIRGNRDLLRALDTASLDDPTLIAHDEARERAYRSHDHQEARQALRDRRPAVFKGK